MINLAWYKVSPKNLDSLPEESGIYILSVLLNSGNFATIYVGQSTNIKSRVKTHFSESESNKELKRYLSNNYTFKVSYAKADRLMLDGLEKYLIYYYEPMFNNQDGNGDDKNRCTLPNVVKYPK